jgi:hypothetical protein
MFSGAPMKKILVLAVSVFTLSMSMTASSEPASPASVKRLMEITGAGNLSVQMMNQMILSLKQQAPGAPLKYWIDFMSEIDSGDMENLVVPIYQKYLTEEDIVAINKFYSSPVGKKLIQHQPDIMKESMAVGQRWGQDLARRVTSRYEIEVNRPIAVKQ